MTNENRKYCLQFATMTTVQALCTVIMYFSETEKLFTDSKL